jgi:hypothetical protein
MNCYNGQIHERPQRTEILSSGLPAAARLAQSEELPFWKEYVFSGFITFLSNDSKPFLSFFSFNQLNDQNSRKSDACRDQNFFGFHVFNTLKNLSKNRCLMLIVLKIMPVLVKNKT